MCFVVKNWPIVTEAHADVKTDESCLLCLLCSGFTKKSQSDPDGARDDAQMMPGAQHQQAHQNWKMMMKINNDENRDPVTW